VESRNHAKGTGDVVRGKVLRVGPLESASGLRKGSPNFRAENKVENMRVNRPARDATISGKGERGLCAHAMTGWNSPSLGQKTHC